MVAHFSVPCHCRAAASTAAATTAAAVTVNQRHRQANISIESNSIQRLVNGESEASNGASLAKATVSYGDQSGASSGAGTSAEADVSNSNQLPAVTSPPTVVSVQKELKRVFLSNRTVTCNDGSQAGFYLRKSPGSRRWVVFFEGGWHCYDHKSCRARWLKLRPLMTSAQWPETRDGKRSYIIKLATSNSLSCILFFSWGSSVSTSIGESVLVQRQPRVCAVLQQ